MKPIEVYVPWLPFKAVAMTVWPDYAMDEVHSDWLGR